MDVEPSVEIVDSPRVERTRPGLGRMLARLSGACLFGTPLLLIVLFNSLSHALLNGAFWAGIAGALLSALASVLCSSMSWPRPRSAVLRASEKGLTIEREGRPAVSIARDRIESGMVISGVPHFRLRIQLRNGDVITADATDEALAQRALAILGVSADVRRVAVQLGTANRQILAAAISLPLTAIFAGGLGIIGVTRWERSYPGAPIDVDMLFTAIWVLFTGLLTYLIVSSFRPTEVIVGSDGIRVQGVHRHEFSHSMIKRAEAHGKKLFLILRGSSGSVPYVAASGEPGVVVGLAERINQAVERARKGPEERPVAGLLDPAGRPLAAWREALRTLVPDAGYRKSGVTRESLIEVLEDPAAPPGRRIGAALALRGAEHPESRARIRIVADACVDDSLRQALEEAAEDELAENTLRRVLR